MKFGMNLLLWSGEMNDALWPKVESLKKMGYDGVEVPIMAPNKAVCADWAKRLDNVGLERTGVTAMGEADNCISPDASVRKHGVETLKALVDCTHVVGASILAGPLHSTLGRFSGKGPTQDEFKWGVESIRAVAEHAQQAGVTLALEYLNRFECYFLNCAADAVKFAEAVDHPNCKIMWDTFHSHIEEKDTAQAIKTAKSQMVHVHISENDRSTPGKGSVKWNVVFDTLKEVGYDDWLVVEAFGLALPELSAATRIWRRMFESEEQLSRDALAFMKQEVKKRW